MRNTNLAVVKQTATRINDLHKELREHGQSMVQIAIQAGGLLVEQKEKLGHGLWLKWVDKNLIFSVRKAQVYIQCYKNKDELNTQSIAHLGEAVRLLASPKKPQLEVVPSKKAQKDEPEKVISEVQEEVLDKTVVPQAPKEACCSLSLIEWQPVKDKPWYSEPASPKIRKRCDDVHTKCVSLHLEMVKFFRNDTDARKEKLSREDWARLHEETKQFGMWMLGVSKGMGKAAGIIPIEK